MCNATRARGLSSPYPFLISASPPALASGRARCGADKVQPPRAAASCQPRGMLAVGRGGDRKQSFTEGNECTAAHKYTADCTAIGPEAPPAGCLPCLCVCDADAVQGAEDNAAVRRRHMREIEYASAPFVGAWSAVAVERSLGEGRFHRGRLYELLQANALLRCESQGISL